MTVYSKSKNRSVYFNFTMNINGAVININVKYWQCSLLIKERISVFSTLAELSDFFFFSSENHLSLHCSHPGHFCLLLSMENR